MMNQNRLGAWLAAALLVCAGLTLWLSARYYLSVGELQGLQAQYLAVNNARAAAQALAKDAVEYSKRNSAIDPLLFQVETMNGFKAIRPFGLSSRPGNNGNALSGRIVGFVSMAEMFPGSVRLEAPPGRAGAWSLDIFESGG